MSTANPVPLVGLPGGEQIKKGLQDFHSRVDSIETCLVQICAPKLALCGYELQAGFQRLTEPSKPAIDGLGAVGRQAR